MPKGNFIVPALDVRAQVLSFYSQKRGWKTSVQACTTRTRPIVRYHCFLILCEPSIFDDVLRRVVCQASLPAQNRAANVS